MSEEGRNGPRVVAGLALLAALAGLVAISRPAKVRSAHVTAVTDGPPAVAHVALAYGGGAAPHSVVLDVRGPSGGGSATVEGARRFAEVVLDGPAAGPYRVTTTAAYRVLGRAVFQRYPE